MLNKKINSNAICKTCGQKQIEYSILNGSYTYYCHFCYKPKSKNEITTENELEFERLHSLSTN